MITEPRLFMRTLTLTVLVLLSASNWVLGQDVESTTALQAIKLLPKGQAKYLARIEARDGKPAPERWYLLIHDSNEENGLHEYVVASGKVVASRAISQFADGLKSEDVIGSESVKVDSNRLSSLARRYAAANDTSIATMNYQLAREGGVPTWKITCLDSVGQPIGSVVINAENGTLVSHLGFPIEPTAKFESPEAIAEGHKPLPITTSSRSAPNAQSTRTSSAKKTTARTRPVEEVEPQRTERGFLQRASGSLQKFFTGRD
jgi:hypothetical protein